MRAFRASSSSSAPSRKSIARRVLPTRLELKRPEGSAREAPLAKVIFTTFLYVSPVQTSPLCDQVGTPAGFDGFLHFRSSVISGSASMIRARRRESSSPLQSGRSSIGSGLAPFDWSFFIFLSPISALGSIRVQKPLHPRVVPGHRPRHEPRFVDEVPAEIRVLEPAGSEPDAIAADRH